MHAQRWDRDRFAETLRQIRVRAELSDQDLAELTGRSRSQVNRWTRAEHQPSFQPLKSLADNLTKYGPDIAALGEQLLDAAGYGTSRPTERTAPTAAPDKADTPPWVYPDPGDLPSHVVLSSLDPAVAQVWTGLTLLSPRDRDLVASLVQTLVAQRDADAGGAQAEPESRRRPRRAG